MNVVKSVEKNGNIVRLIIIRPELPKLAIQFTDLINRLRNNGEMTDSQHSKAFQEMLSLQHYRVIGFAAEKAPHILGIAQEGQVGGIVDRLQPGDSIVDEDDLSKWKNLSAELREAVVLQ